MRLVTRAKALSGAMATDANQLPTGMVATTALSEVRMRETVLAL